MQELATLAHPELLLVQDGFRGGQFLPDVPVQPVAAPHLRGHLAQLVLRLGGLEGTAGLDQE